MTDVRTQRGSADETGSCPACQKPPEGDRCHWCGAAIAPGGYQIERVLSQGPHGRVYLARDPEGKPAALKELQFAQVPGARDVDAFEREARTLAELSHPRIPRFYRSFREGSGVHLRLYLAAEYVSGESLAERIARAPLSESEARDVARQVLEVLAYLHSRTPPVLHRDLKPENLIVRPDGAVVLVDFGTARHLSGTRTFGSTLVGTFGYMPPEQLGGTADASSDLYALGATLLHALTGRPPGEWLKGDLALTIPEQVPTGLRPLLEAMLQRDPKDRLRSARAALEVLSGKRRLGLRTTRRRLALALFGLVLAGVLAFRLSATSSTVPPRTVVDEPATNGLPYGSSAAKRWFAQIKPRCNALEVEQAMRRTPPPAGWDGAGYAASCFALAGRTADARKLLTSVPAGTQANAAAILFELGHPIADSGDNVSAAQIMNLVLEFWPQNYQARYHAGMSDYALGHVEQARANLVRFLGEYRQDDGFTRSARDVLQRIEQGLPPDPAQRAAPE